MPLNSRPPTVCRDWKVFGLPGWASEEKTSNLLLYLEVPYVAWHVGGPWRLELFFLAQKKREKISALRLRVAEVRSVSIALAGQYRSAAERGLLSHLLYPLFFMLPLSTLLSQILLIFTGKKCSTVRRSRGDSSKVVEQTQHEGKEVERAKEKVEERGTAGKGEKRQLGEKIQKGGDGRRQGESVRYRKWERQSVLHGTGTSAASLRGGASNGFARSTIQLLLHAHEKKNPRHVRQHAKPILSRSC